MQAQARSRPDTPRHGPGRAFPSKAVRWILDKYGPLVVRPQADPRMWRWMLQMLRNYRQMLRNYRMVPVAESNIERKALIHKASLNEISACANTSTNTISALKNRRFDSRR